MAEAAEHPLIVIAGPTGSGKSELALRVAERFDGEIVNCDSVQVYRGFDIGTAKLRVQDRRGIPHHLIDIVEADALFTAGDFARVGRQHLREIVSRGHVPVMAGGTGFYLRALLEGLSPGPARDEQLRSRLLLREQRRGGSMHRILSRLDREAGTRIHPNDLNKTLRALELRFLRGAPGATLPNRDALSGFRVMKIGLRPDRARLHERLNQRLRSMFDHGLIEEVRSLLIQGISPDARPFASLGYKEALLFVTGKLSLEAAIEAAQLATRHYAKRQLTWFRRESGMHWFEGFGDDAVIQEAVHCAIDEFFHGTK